MRTGEEIKVSLPARQWYWIAGYIGHAMTGDGDFVPAPIEALLKQIGEGDDD